MPPPRPPRPTGAGCGTCACHSRIAANCVGGAGRASVYTEHTHPPPARASPARSQGRLKKLDGAIALRIRWYGHTPADGDLVFVERKVHREDWFNEGHASTKERVRGRATHTRPKR